VSWTSALQLVVSCEGGFVLSNPPEGATYAGVMQKYYVLWCQQHGRNPVWPPTQEAVASYYHDAYFTAYHCDAFPDPADAVALQLVVNLPYQHAKQALQISVGAYPDADIGPLTLAAIRNWPARELADRLVCAQLMHYCDTNPIGGDNFRGLVQARIGKVRAFLASA
jgi:lysozyme family protein